MNRLLLLSIIAALGCGSPQKALPDAVDLGIPDDAARLLLIGDSGVFDDTEDACDPLTQQGHIPSTCRDALFASMAAEEAHAIVDLGDLVYEDGPLCPGGSLTSGARERLDTLLGDIAEAVGAPLVLVLGNHDVHQSRSGRADAEACYLRYAEERSDVHFPERSFFVNAGPADLLVLDTNRPLDDGLRDAIAAELERRTAPWTLMAAHHVWRTYGDKDGQHEGPRYAAEIGTHPDLWLNGHAHLLQFGVYDEVGAVTSGASGKLRVRDECPAPPCANDGQLFGLSRYGYAVLDLARTRARVTFKDVTGAPLFAWERELAGDAAGAVVDLATLSP